MLDTQLSTESENQVILVQVGRSGVLGDLWLPEALSVAADDWVVCQTGRGIEMGQVRLVRSPGDLAAEEVVGKVLRIATDNDRLVEQRINRSLSVGIDACNQWLSERDFEQLLLDVDIPLDGLRLYFQFLGDVDARLEAAIEELVELFDQATGVRGFTQAVLVGCGPSCGSDGSGCSSRGAGLDGGEGQAGIGGSAASSGCRNCALSGGCKQK